MKFITAEPEHFHPYLVAKFYQKAVVAEDEQSFATEVHDTQFDISPRFLVEEFELSNSGACISSYHDGTSNIERGH